MLYYLQFISVSFLLLRVYLFLIVLHHYEIPHLFYSVDQASRHVFMGTRTLHRILVPCPPPPNPPQNPNSHMSLK